MGGWYLADLVTERVASDDPRTVVQISTRLIQADTAHAALACALELGREQEITYESSAGASVQVHFRGLHTLLQIDGALEHGAELRSSEEIGLAAAEVQELIVPIAELPALRAAPRPGRARANAMPGSALASLRAAGDAGATPPPPAAHIRPCAPADLDAVLAFEQAWEREGIAQGFAPISRAEYAEALAQFPDYFLIAEQGGRAVGYINGALRSGEAGTVIPVGEPYLMVENLYVDAGARGQSVGGDLLERLLEIAQRRGIARAMVASNSRRMSDIVRFYRSHGFRRCRVELYRGGDDGRS